MMIWRPPPPLSRLPRDRLPPVTLLQKVKRRKKSASRAIEPTSVATSSVKRMSRLRTCASSWPMTPCSSSRSSFWSRPVVIATLACFGSRPVAKAFGAVSSIRWTRGIGMLAAIASSRTTFISCGAV